jgi:hypothetical protein
VVERFPYRLGDDPAEHHLNKDALQTCLRHTAFGEFWEPGHKGAPIRICVPKMLIRSGQLSGRRLKKWTP